MNFPLYSGLLQSDLACAGYQLGNVGGITLVAGHVTLFQAPTLPGHSATKAYVDAAVTAALPVAGRGIVVSGATVHFAQDANYTAGGLPYASGTTGIGFLAAVATGNALLSGGVGAVPVWGKVGLTTHVSGILGVANGGTGTSTAFTVGSVVFAGASGVYAQDNANLFWNNTTKRLGVGTNAPAGAMEVRGTGTVLSRVRCDEAAEFARFNILNAVSGSALDMQVAGTTANIAIFGQTGGSAAKVTTNGTTRFMLGCEGTALLILGTNNVERMRLHSGSGGIRINPSAAPGTPADGDIWSDSTRVALQMFTAGIQQQVVGRLFAQITTVAWDNSNAEHSFYGAGVGSRTLPSNFLIPSGKNVRLTSFGLFSYGLSSGDIFIRLKYGSLVIAEAEIWGLAAGFSNAPYRLDADIVHVGGNVLRGSLRMTVMTDPDGAKNLEFMANGSASSVSLSSAQAVDLTMQLQTATPAVGISANAGTVVAY